MYEEQGDYEQAKLQYQYAKAVYEELDKPNKADEVQGKIDIVETKKEKSGEGAGAGESVGNGGSGNSGNKTVSGNVR